eukprot:g5316.t1
MRARGGRAKGGRAKAASSAPVVSPSKILQKQQELHDKWERYEADLCHTGKAGSEWLRGQFAALYDRTNGTASRPEPHTEPKPEDHADVKPETEPEPEPEPPLPSPSPMEPLPTQKELKALKATELKEKIKALGGTGFNNKLCKAQLVTLLHKMLVEEREAQTEKPKPDIHGSPAALERALQAAASTTAPLLERAAPLRELCDGGEAGAIRVLHALESEPAAHVQLPRPRAELLPDAVLSALCAFVDFAWQLDGHAGAVAQARARAECDGAWALGVDTEHAAQARAALAVQGGDRRAALGTRGDGQFRVALSLAQLNLLAGHHAVSYLVSSFGDVPSQIQLRRAAAGGEDMELQGEGALEAGVKRCIRLHVDCGVARTMQVPLNDPREYTGGELLFASFEHSVQRPSRAAGSATIHDCTLPHCVTTLRHGTRYGLFLLGGRPAFDDFPDSVVEEGGGQSDSYDAAAADAAVEGGAWGLTKARRAREEQARREAEEEARRKADGAWGLTKARRAREEQARRETEEDARRKAEEAALLSAALLKAASHGDVVEVDGAWGLTKARRAREEQEDAVKTKNAVLRRERQKAEPHAEEGKSAAKDAAEAAARAQRAAARTVAWIEARARKRKADEAKAAKVAAEKATEEEERRRVAAAAKAAIAPQATQDGAVNNIANAEF